MTFEEFKDEKLMAPQECSATNSFKPKDELKLKAIPDSYEWNNYGMVSPVKNQGSCGSCWTFSTVGSLESHWNILQKGKNVTFSEQQLVDCAGDFDNHGCKGGLPSHAFEYIKYAGGIESDVTYPYTAKDGTCVFRRSIAVGYVRHGSYNITQGDEVELAERLYNSGPISVSFQVIAGFKSYLTGVYSVDNCGKTTQDVNHAVLATGFGTENGAAYWNVKNSWGAAWGNQGYFKIARGTNMCAIAQCNSYPLIDERQLEGLESTA
jgi:cathepsin H